MADGIHLRIVQLEETRVRQRHAIDEQLVPALAFGLKQTDSAMTKQRWEAKLVGELNSTNCLIMLSLTAAALAFSGPAIKPMGAPVQAKMVQSQALPFLEAPPKLDGSMVGDVGFDPLNLSEVADLKWMREAELKHGRVCMLAWAGYVAVDLGWVAPGAPKGISSLAAHDVTVKSGQMLLLLGTVGVFEALTYNAVSEMMKSETDRAPGDFGLDPFSWAKANPTRMQTAELLHGRTAMLAFSGVVTQSALKGVCFPYF